MTGSHLSYLRVSNFYVPLVPREGPRNELLLGSVRDISSGGVAAFRQSPTGANDHVPHENDTSGSQVALLRERAAQQNVEKVARIIDL